ncbi:protein Njmu-R1, partial [Tachysurus ichikawai]
MITKLPPRVCCSLTLLDSSLPSEAEPELRSYISRRLSKGALLGGMGNIATVEL